MIELNNQDLLFKRVELKEQESEKLDIKPYSFWGSVLKEMLRKKGAILSFILIIIVLLFTIFGPMVRTIKIDGLGKGKNLFPNSTYWFGTDQYFKDVWTQVWLGARTSLSLAFVVAAINIVIGITIGSIWGYFRKLDPFFLELKNLISNIPTILINIVLVAIISTRGFWAITFCLTLFGWFGLASYVRNHIIIISNREYNIASRTLGTNSFNMIVHNILPYLVSVIITYIANMVPSVIGAEVTLNYLGLGFTNGTVSLGTVLQNGYSSEYMYYPHILLFPTIILAIITLSFFVIGLALADASDPRKHR